jgi:hypothetical protein
MGIKWIFYPEKVEIHTHYYFMASQSLAELSDAILDSYAICTDIYFGLRGPPSEKDFEVLRAAFKAVQQSIQTFTEKLEADGLSKRDSWTWSKWMFEDYHHKGGLYMCPADMLDEIAGVAKK